MPLSFDQECFLLQEWNETLRRLPTGWLAGLGADDSRVSFDDQYRYNHMNDDDPPTVSSRREQRLAVATQ